MQTITINTYNFSELSEDAQNKAIEYYRSNNDGQFYFNEITQSVEKVAELFNLKFGREYTDIRYGHIDDVILELKGIRLMKYILNNYGIDLFKPKYVKTIEREVKFKPYICKVSTSFKNEKYTMLYSKHKRDNECVLTGMCYDNDILYPIYDFLQNPQKDTTLEDLFNEIEYSIQKTFNDCETWINSNDFITEEIESNNYQFTEDGEIF